MARQQVVDKVTDVTFVDDSLRGMAREVSNSVSQGKGPRNSSIGLLPEGYCNLTPKELFAQFSGLQWRLQLFWFWHGERHGSATSYGLAKARESLRLPA